MPALLGGRTQKQAMKRSRSGAASTEKRTRVLVTAGLCHTTRQLTLSLAGCEIPCLYQHFFSSEELTTNIKTSPGWSHDHPGLTTTCGWQVRELTKSMLAAKTFEATSNMAALERWLGILADELAERMVTDAQLNQRFPRLLVLSYRCRLPRPPA